MIDPEHILKTKRATIKLAPVPLGAGQKVLDLGGGGEGVISVLYQEQVTAIDLRAEELQEMNESLSLKIVMDAANMAFIDEQFDRATAFYSLMYMKEDVIKKVLREVHRVLKQDGILEIWDVAMPAANQVAQQVFVVQLDVLLPHKRLTPSYGVALKQEKQDLASITALLLENGFAVPDTRQGDNGIFYLQAIKKSLQV